MNCLSSTTYSVISSSTGADIDEIEVELRLFMIDAVGESMKQRLELVGVFWSRFLVWNHRATLLLVSILFRTSIKVIIILSLNGLDKVVRGVSDHKRANTIKPYNEAKRCSLRYHSYPFILLYKPHNARSLPITLPSKRDSIFHLSCPLPH